MEENELLYQKEKKRKTDLLNEYIFLFSELPPALISILILILFISN